MKRNSTTYSTALFILVALAFIFVGCSTDTSVAPVQQTGNGLQVKSTDGLVTMLQMKQGSLAKSEGTFFTEVFIDAEQGGQLVVGNPSRGYSKLIFPPNAVSEDMTISLEFWIDDFFEGLFEPHGTYFNEPVRVELSYKNADLSDVEDENDLQIYYYNESIGLWEHVGGDVDTDNKIVVCYLEHFSRYAIIKT